MSDFVALPPAPEPEYTRNADGYYVGTDGFVVPRNFAEFQERYPLYILDWVRKRLFGKRNFAEMQDLTSDLTLHMMTLPEVSIFRDMGFSDRVAAFNPNKGYVRGSTGPRFFHYLKNCFNNFYLTVHQKRTPAAQVLVSEFINFVERHRPELLPTLQAICNHETYFEARIALSQSVEGFNCSRSRLDVLRQCFDTGSPVPGVA